MQNIVHDKNYISKQKKLYFLLSLLSLIILLVLYAIYKIFFPQKHLIIALAALCSIPFSQFSIRFSLFWGIKDCNYKIADEIAALAADCFIINNALMTDGKKNIFIDNIIISQNNIICITDNNSKNSDSTESFIKALPELKKISFNIYTIYTDIYSLDKVKAHISNTNFDSEDILTVLKSYLI